ncbi:hypothetical protein Nepgr_031985 [Nepenthes gracilis]|uniref:Uncharacterized protein n=1 Tax=Nepenthes gracilis TaxID=150966 RepID=A0AAD3TIK3_NEPGR|nr:hypothetical protein Nepgr_031985 [Nepenthes gracilis]
MAGILNYAPSPVFRPLLSQRVPKRGICFKASTEVSQTPADSSVKEESSAGASTSTLTFSPPPDFKPAEPKPFKIRADRRLDILGLPLASLFRLGTGAFVSGYSGSLVPKNEIPSDQYALEIAGSGNSGGLDLDVLFYPCLKTVQTSVLKLHKWVESSSFPTWFDGIPFTFSFSSYSYAACL